MKKKESSENIAIDKISKPDPKKEATKQEGTPTPVNTPAKIEEGKPKSAEKSKKLETITEEPLPETKTLDQNEQKD